MTTIVVLGYPRGDGKRPGRLGRKQGKAFAEILLQIGQWVGGKQVAVLVPLAEEASFCADLVTEHFAGNSVPCDGIIRRVVSPDPNTQLACTEGFLCDKFGLVVVIVATDSAMDFACALAKCPTAEGTEVYTYPNPLGV